MDKIIVHGGRQLSGKIKVSGAKNAVLPVIAASILGSKGTSVIEEVPALDDVFTIIEVLRYLNIKASYQDGNLTINASEDVSTEAPYEYVRKMRASVLVMGSLLAREGRAKVALPGGCAIGSRPIDQHLKGFEALGGEVTVGNGFVEVKRKGRLKGAKVYLDIPSVGATENIMMAATLAEGTTVIENAAEEPEIVDLANYLNAMGSNVRGAGTGTIRIEGVQELCGTRHAVIPDRIEAGTYMIAAAMTKSKLQVDGAISQHLYPLVAKLTEMGVDVQELEDGITVDGRNRKLKSVDVKTLPYPGFPTDLQAQMMALLCVSNDAGVITETVFENRFMHVEEFKRMNASIKIEGRSAFVKGNTTFKGAKVSATDLRAGAALILAGLVAEGQTEIGAVHHIDRGYDNIVHKLVKVGAQLDRMNEAGEIVDEKVNSINMSQASFA
ncbi:UDP-N-acetylglucosamine 1-carboxyvinyltransferase [Caldalkalibacillus salinus]|uniref:UDP-N-acetylglucosamine 1-carboxyvinyltransferase n=1 Tax=Caldalkalibacillus salinus TaxID=2803787 RepID=UPI0019228423|nr:UDP-N-acetylglucosamine 1-carboxyvinyltransferase [Caldalkalibacillus salinus]